MTCRARGLSPCSGAPGHAAADRLRDHAREHGVRQRVIGQDAGAEPLPLPDDAEQEMLRAHITVPHAQAASCAFVIAVDARCVNRSLPRIDRLPPSLVIRLYYPPAGTRKLPNPGS